MVVDSFFYCVGQGLKNIRRNKLFSIASIATMTACLFLFGIMYFVLVNVQYMILEAEKNVGVTVFFDEGTDEEFHKNVLLPQVQAIDGVKKGGVAYKSAESTWEEYKQTHLNEDVVDSFGQDNPLADSASFIVYFDNVEVQKEAVEEILQLEGVRKVNDTEDLVNTLSKINRGLSIGSVVLVVLLLSIAAFLISTTVTMGISVRRREISIMHLIGATDIFIRAPFLVEGVTIGLLGACIPVSVLYALYYKLVDLIASKFSSVMAVMNFVPVKEVFFVLAPVSLCIGVGIGFLGSYFTLNKQLREFRQM